MQNIKAALFVYAVSICCALAQPSPEQHKKDGFVHRAAWESRQDAPSLRGMSRPRRQFALGRLGQNDARPVKRKPGLSPVGVARALPADVKSTGEWSTTSDGKPVWQLAVSSSGAQALRLHFKDFHVGSAKVWVLGKDSEGIEISAGPYQGDGPNGDGDFWSDLIAADNITVAYEPEGERTETVPFTLHELSHRFAPVTTVAPKAAADPPSATAATCTLDSTCYSELNEPASAVALMVFESDGGTYQCSGSLIASASQPVLPFFLTAHHCIATADEARSLITFFNYQTSSCNGTPPTLSRTPRVVGATFVAGEGMELGDFTLLRLSGFPSVDVKLLGWSSDEIASNARVTSISHPRGDYKRIAFGRRSRDVTIRFDGGERMPASKGYQVAWFEGVTQGGSSGSPLLVNLNGKEYVVGTLTGGPEVDEDDSVAVCRTDNLVASYGRFPTAYPYLAAYLSSLDGGAQSTPVSRASLTASALPSGRTSGAVALNWQAPDVSRVQIRIGSPTGVAMTGIEGSSGSAMTGNWARAGMVFYLQNASDGDSLGPAKTLATATISAGSPAFRSGTLLVTPSVISIPAGETAASATLQWSATGVTQVQIRVNSPFGSPMTGLEGPAGSTNTDKWVTNGTIFYLQDASDGDSSGPGKTLASIRAQVVAQ